jgi:hypothetical protein
MHDVSVSMKLAKSLRNLILVTSNLKKAKRRYVVIVDLKKLVSG